MADHDDVIAARISRMPKAEIHVHLEGATTADTYFEIARRNGIELPTESLPQWVDHFKFRDFDHFIEVYVGATKFLRTADDYGLLVRRFGAQQAALNVTYTETFVSCSLVPQQIDRAAFLDAIREAAEEVEREHGVAVRFIADISREIPSSQARVLDLAIEGRKRGVFIGVGLGGPEVGFPPELFAETYRAARNAGLHVVAHAGETVGTASMLGALDALGAERIGHGILSLENPDLIERLRATQIPLEICPQSNYRIGVAKPGRPHQIRALQDAGVYCTVNSDDPAMFETDLNNEYATLAAQNFTWDELWALNLATLEATFASDADKLAMNQQRNEFAAPLSSSATPPLSSRA
jgi:adenosine deaminase